jgi:hypothetical protein
MICKLCHQDKKLLKHSHIIPDFAYKGIYDEKHQIYYGNFINPDKGKLIPSAPYDKNILCRECDGDIIGRLDHYASLALYGNNPSYKKIKILKIKSPNGPDYLHIENIDYRFFKLFILSVLWRASVSKHPIFKNIDLGKFEGEIGEMILKGDPKDFSKFKTCLILADKHEKLNTEMVSEPRKISSSSPFYIFFINRLFYLINLSDDNNNEIFDIYGLKENNTINIPILTGDFLLSFYDTVIGLKLRKE